MNQISLSLLKRFARLARPYWTSDEKWRAWSLAGLLMLLMVAETSFNVFFNEQSGEFTSALAAQDGPRFWRSIRLFSVSLAVAVPIYSYYYFLRDKLSIHWRRWLTSRTLTQYFANHAFYRIHNSPEIDNPDQRIAEDIASFTQRSLTFLLLFANAGLQLAAFSGVLWHISRSMVMLLVLYAAMGTYVTVALFGGKLIQLQFNQLRREADFRFGLIRIRENAESIALYHGEGQEQARVEGRFGELFANFNRLIAWTLRLGFFQNSYNLFTLALPSIILAPRVLSGELEVGRVVQGAGAFAAILGALTLLMDNIESLSRFAAGVERLDAFFAYIAPRQLAAASGGIVTCESEELRFDGVTVETPDGERRLVRELTLTVAAGEHLMIVGPSGCGKSSLLRAVAGLWESGAGTLERPGLGDVRFIPQHAYMILGNLRQQLLYPRIGRMVSDEELREVLGGVNLADLPERCGGFDQELDFERILSVGERQRLAIAKVLLARPRYAFLDEATSALDPENEAAVFERLLETPTTLVSVSHHPALVRYHTRILELDKDGGWQVQPAATFCFSGDLV